MNRRQKSFLAKILVACAIFSFSGMAKVGVKAEDLSTKELYKKAYDSTVQALTDKSQQSINQAREVLDLLATTDAKWAIPEFSRQLNSVQKPILAKAVEAIEYARLHPTQENVNKAREAVDKDLYALYRWSYSCAIDVIQQQVMAEAKNSITEALKTREEKDINKAYELLEQVSLTTNEEVKKWVVNVKENFEAELTADPQDILVEEVK